jgi:hypothetical protein
MTAAPIKCLVVPTALVRPERGRLPLVLEATGGEGAREGTPQGRPENVCGSRKL